MLVNRMLALLRLIIPSILGSICRLLTISNMNSSNPFQISKDDLNFVFVPLLLSDIKRLERMFSFWIKAFGKLDDRDLHLRELFVYILYNVEQFKVYTGDSKV